MEHEKPKFPKPHKLAITLAAVLIVAGSPVAGVYDLTKETIAEQIRLKKLRLLRSVLPQIDNDIDREFEDKVIGRDRRGDDVLARYFFGRKDGELVGTAFALISPDGFTGDIEFMMGVSPQGEVTGVEIVRHLETPGLGDKIVYPEWRSGFVGRSLTNAQWAVKKDGGDFDQFTGATISPRAVVKRIKEGLELYQKEYGDGKN
jgi:Na+-translocating ferredoxin:NAD+ oxidoreductase subunit G